MKELYLKTSQELSALLTARYSTSFSLGIKVFPENIRRAIFSIYGFVRIADEIVDTFYEHDQRVLLNDFKQQTDEAIKKEVSTNPILHSFQNVVHQYNIDLDYIESFFHSMEMDLEKVSYSYDLYQKYIYGSAEVVGLMCLKVFCQHNEPLFEELKPFAMKLGSAYQKVNFLRDIQADYELRGRIYFPQIDNKEKWTNDIKKVLESDIEKEFLEALVGIKRLPKSCQFANYLVFLYYQALLSQIKKVDIRKLFQKRISVSFFKKIALLFKAFAVTKFIWR